MPLISTSALIACAAVILGALGAHELRGGLEASGHLETWQTATLYLLVHALALLAVAIWRDGTPRVHASRWITVTVVLWLAGSAGFSGSLYALALGAPRWFGPVTPLGGICLIGGWLVLSMAGFRIRRITGGHA